MAAAAPTPSKSRGPKLSDDLKQRIVDAWQEDPNDPPTYAALSKRFSVNSKTIYYLIKRFKERGTVVNNKAPGKPRKTSERTDRRIVRESDQHPFKTTRYF